jgi:putative serine protease PepD
VGTVTNGSPAEKAGLGKDDVITKFDGKAIRSPSDLSLEVLRKRPGDKAQVEFQRGGDTKTVTVTLGNRPNAPVQ